MKDIVPGVLNLAAKEDPELREGALQALEALVYRCPAEITQFLIPIIALGIQLIRYDPVSSVPSSNVGASISFRTMLKLTMVTMKKWRTPMMHLIRNSMSEFMLA